LRAIMTGLLSLLLVPVSWAIFLSITPFATPGFTVAHWVATRPPSFVGDLNATFEIAAIVDFAVWFGLVWGVQNLCTQLGEERQASGITRHWRDPLRGPGVWFGALLCAIPLSYYAVLGVAVLVKLNTLRRPELFLVVSLTLSFAVCFAAICGLYAVAARYWPKSGKLKK
jgi:hypothetical protein